MAWRGGKRGRGRGRVSRGMMRGIGGQGRGYTQYINTGNMERVKHKIFGFHQKFHNRKDSKGLGLFLVKSQINALGGEIEVDSEENIGTTFTITFKEI
jgi:K+-sensing histidine kinase KdpD